MEENKELTLEDRIKALEQQQEQAKEVFIKCSGAIEVLKEMRNDATADQ